jgi:putative transposase
LGLANEHLDGARQAMADEKDTIVRTYEYKLRMNRNFRGACEKALDDARSVYNAALHQRLSWYHHPFSKSISYVEQSRQLTEARELPEVKACLRAIQQDALEKLDEAFKAFFRRVKKGETPGFPRFKGRARYHTFSQQIEKVRACPLKGDKLTVPGIGSCRVRLSRPIEGTVKQLRITRRADGWFVLLVCEMPKPEPLPPAGDAVGIDVGLENFATLSTGETIDNPRHLRKAERRLQTAQRKVSRRKKGSHRRRKAVRLLRLQHLTISRQRKDFHHKTANPIVKEFDTIAVEDLKIRNMVRNPKLAKSISDAGWGNFINVLSIKAESAGREVVKVNPAFSSQDCSRCGERMRLSLAVREFKCLVCGYTEHRDLNAAINLKARVAPSGRGQVAAPDELRTVPIDRPQPRLRTSRGDGQPRLTPKRKTSPSSARSTS